MFYGVWMDSLYYGFLMGMLQKFREQQVIYQEDEFISSVILELEKVLNGGEVHTNLTVLNIQEEDRQRIARDLHDTSLQNLTHLIHKIDLCKLYIDKDPLQAKLELSIVNKEIRKVIDEIRNTIFDLRPMTFDDLGLKAAIERLVNVINENKVYQLDIIVDDVSCENSMFLVNIYRVIQESLMNIVKHSQADSILLHCINRDKKYLIDIADNGVGFDFSKMDRSGEKHFGISLMKERINLLGGSIEFFSEKDVGAKIHMEIPLL